MSESGKSHISDEDHQEKMNGYESDSSSSSNSSVSSKESGRQSSTKENVAEQDIAVLDPGLEKQDTELSIVPPSTEDLEAKPSSNSSSRKSSVSSKRSSLSSRSSSVDSKEKSVSSRKSSISSSSSSESETEDKQQPPLQNLSSLASEKPPTPTEAEPMPTSVELESSSEESKPKKVQITDSSPERPSAANPKSARFRHSAAMQREEPVSSELHVIRYRKPRSAPARPRGFHAQSSNLAFLERECERLERKMAKTAKANLVNRPKVSPYKPFTWNSLAPYYNTDTLRYIIKMPVPVRRGYNTRATASGLVDPEVSWKMDHCLTPVTPSRPELYRHHFAKRRTQSAMPRLGMDNSLLTPRFPRVTTTAYGITPETKRSTSGGKTRPKNI